MYSQFMM